MPKPPDGSQSPKRLTTVSMYGNKAPSTRVRVADWLSHLNLAPESINHAGLGNLRPPTVLRHVGKVVAGELATRRAAHQAHDRLLLSREASPLSHGGVEERLLRSASHSVYDFDDALFEDGSGFRSVYRRPTKCRRAAAAADVVIAGNEYLANWAEQHARDVRMIPSCVEPSQYQVKRSWTISETPVIVWLGSGGTEMYLESIAPELRELHQRTGARLRIISAPGRVKPAFEGFVDRVPWDLATMPSLLASADVAIAPLVDTAFSRGKCAYKLLQYAASGLPIVGTPVGANKLALRRFDGVIVDRGDRWTDAIGGVLSEPEGVRRQRGLTGIGAVEAHYSFGAWENEWKKAVGIQ